MKKAILKVLLENTQIEGRYIGGDEVPIISFKHSEECDLELFLSQIADEIVSALANQNGA